MREASFELMGLQLYRNSTLMSLQNECKDGTSHHTEEPLGMRVHMKISTLKRSEGVGTLVVERHRPLYDRQKNSTIIKLGRESMRQEICGVRGRRATGDTTATWLGVILRDSVESSIVHSLILKPFETFYYNLM